MSKKLLLTAGGAFTVLLAGFAILSTSFDQSQYQQDSTHFLKLQQQGTTQMEEVDITNGATLVPTATAALPTNVTKITQSIKSAFKESNLFEEGYPRLETFASTDKMVYRSGDMVFVEVLIIDTFTKQPYISSDEEFEINVQIVDEDGMNAGLDTQVQSITGPTASFFFKLESDFIGNYILRVYSDIAGPSQKMFQVRESPDSGQKDEIKNSYEFKFIIFNKDFIVSSPVFGKVIATKNGIRSSITDQMTIKGQFSGTQAEIIYDDISIVDGEAFFYFQANAALFVESAYILHINATYSDEESGDYKGEFYLLNPNTDPATFNPDAEEEPEEVDNSIDPKEIKAFFITESNTDLMINGTHKIYFYVYRENEDGIEILRTVNASLKYFDTAVMGAPVKLATGLISSSLNGFGSFSYTHKPKSLPFLEILLPQNDGTRPENEAVRNISEAEITKGELAGNHPFPNGTIRIPMVIEGIQTKRARLEKALYNDFNSDKFDYTLLEDFTFNVSKSYGAGEETTTLYFGYADGFFTVGLPKMPPLLVFNSFPNKANFTNTLGFNYQYVQGVKTVDQKEVEDEEVIKVVQTSFNISDITSDFIEITMEELDEQIENALDNLGLSTENTDDENVEILTAVFTQVPGTVALDTTYFGDYGPTCDIDMPVAPEKSTTVVVAENYEDVSINFVLAKKIVASTDDIVLTVSTNNFHEAKTLYYIAIKQKEKVLYAQYSTFKTNTANQVVTISKTLFGSNSGGIFSVKIYRITKDFQTFNALTGTIGFCDTEILQEAIDDLTNSQKLKFNTTQYALAQQGDLFYSQSSINETAKLLNISVIPKNINCIYPDYSIQESFLKEAASIQIFRKPVAVQPTIKITPNKVQYIAGEFVSVTVKVTSAINGGTNPLQYLKVVVNEDVNFGINDTSLAGQIYLERETDDFDFSFIDSSAFVDQYFNSPFNATISKDANLDLLLGTLGLRNQLYEVNALNFFFADVDEGDDSKSDILGAALQENGRNQYGYYMPSTAVELEQVYGANFFEGSYEFDDMNWPSMRHLKGSSFPYIRAAADEDFITEDQVNDASKWAHELDADYIRGKKIDLSETLFFASGAQLNSKNEYTFTFEASDLESNFRINVNTYGVYGISQASSVIRVVNPISIVSSFPQVMVKGDVLNITMNITNLNPYSIIFSPQVTCTYCTVDFKYNVYNAVTKLWSSQSTFNVLPNQTYTAVGVVTAKSIGDGKVKIGVKYAAFEDEEQQIYQQVSLPYSIVTPAFVKTTTNAGNIAVGMISSSFPSSFTQTIKLPSSENWDSLSGGIKLFPNYYSYAESSIEYVLQDDDNNGAFSFLGAQDIANRLEQLYLVYAKMSPALLAQSNKLLQGPAYQLQYKARTLYKALDTYQQVNKKDGLAGYDYIPYNAQGGNVVLTAYILSVVNKMPFLDNMSNSNSNFHQNFNWILRRRNADKFGNFSLQANETELTGFAPINVTSAYIISCIKDITFANGTSLDLTFEYNNLITYTSKTFVAGSATITSDPYFLALVITILPKPTYSTVITTYLTELLRLQNTTGAFVPPAARANYSFTAFNQIQRDRIIESTALAVVAIVKQGTATTAQNSAVLKAQNYLRTLTLGSNIGFKQASAAATKALAANYKAPVNIQKIANISVKTSSGINKNISYNVFMDSAFFIPLNELFEKSLAGQSVTVTISLVMIQLTNTIEEIKMGYSTQIFALDETYLGASPLANRINITASPAKPNVIGTKANNGSTTIYNLIISNLDKTRGVNSVNGIFNFPTCLTLNVAALQAQTKVDGPFQQTWINPDNSFEFHIKALKLGEVRTIPVSFTQTFPGKCSDRQSLIQIVNAGDEVVINYSTQ